MTMNKDTLYVKRKRPTDMLLLAAIYVSATLAVALLLGIILYVFVKPVEYPVHHRDHSVDRDPHRRGKCHLPE